MITKKFIIHGFTFDLKVNREITESKNNIEIELIENSNKKRKVKLVVSSKTLAKLESWTSIGGFKRFDIDVYDDKSTEPLSKESDINDYLEKILGSNPSIKINEDDNAATLKTKIQAIIDKYKDKKYTDLQPAEKDEFDSIENMRKRMVELENSSEGKNEDFPQDFMHYSDSLFKALPNAEITLAKSDDSTGNGTIEFSLGDKEYTLDITDYKSDEDKKCSAFVEITGDDEAGELSIECEPTQFSSKLIAFIKNTVKDTSEEMNRDPEYAASGCSRIIIPGGGKGGVGADIVCWEDKPGYEKEPNPERMEQIVTAVNNTYIKGIDPLKIDSLIEALRKIEQNELGINPRKIAKTALINLYKQ